ncbi:MAG: glycosyltransferase family 2 protein [Deltaproteobacteria bacterium]|nr:glycosyltransferase family 2 protein [Deltaproteobacteria bacterium]
MKVDLVTVIVVNWNGKPLIPECLESLRKQEFRDFGTIFVDNFSLDGSVDWVKKHYPEIKTISLSRNTGFCVANNIAFSKVKTKYVALLNNDAVAHPLWLLNLVTGLETHEQAGSAASKILHYAKPDIIDRAGDGYTHAGAGLLRGRGMPSDAYDKPQWIFGACAAAALYRKSMIDEIGFFDEDFFLIYEDVDLSFRAQLNGYKCLYIPDATVYHKASSTIVRDSDISIYYGHRNLEWVYFKNMPSVLLMGTLLFHTIHTVGSILYFSFKGNVKSIIRAKSDALKQIREILKKRQDVQKSKKADNAYLWNLFEKEYFFNRLAMRSSKDRETGNG